jgi:hypothetical protein
MYAHHMIEKIQVCATGMPTTRYVTHRVEHNVDQLEDAGVEDAVGQPGMIFWKTEVCTTSTLDITFEHIRIRANDTIYADTRSTPCSTTQSNWELRGLTGYQTHW